MSGLFLYPSRLRSYTGAGAASDQKIIVRPTFVTLSDSGVISFIPEVKGDFSSGVGNAGGANSMSISYENPTSSFSSSWISVPPGASSVSISFGITALDWEQEFVDPGDPMDAKRIIVYSMNCYARLYKRVNGIETLALSLSNTIGSAGTGGGTLPGAVVNVSTSSWSSSFSYPTGFTSDQDGAFQIRLGKTRGAQLSSLIGSASRSQLWSASCGNLEYISPSSLKDIDANVSYIVVE